jgi:hypothetical protein
MLGYENKKMSELTMSQEEWKELNDLRAAITQYPASVVPEKQERFTELLVRSWKYIDAVPGLDGSITGTRSGKIAKKVV